MPASCEHHTSDASSGLRPGWSAAWKHQWDSEAPLGHSDAPESLLAQLPVNSCGWSTPYISRSQVDTLLLAVSEEGEGCCCSLYFFFFSCFKYEFSHVTGSVPCPFLCSSASAHEPGRTQVQAGRGERGMGVICKAFMAGRRSVLWVH